MKANELMVGDWVYNKNIDKPMQIYPMIFSQMFRSNLNATTEDYNIFPITITAKILEKNGFVNDRGIYCWEDENKQITYFSKENNRPYCMYSFVNIENGCIDVNELPIEYVHELQHTLRLCGIKIEIEL